MSCAEVRAALPAYLEGSLPGAEARELAEHLAACPACRGEAAALSEVDRLLGLLSPRTPLPRSLEARLAAFPRRRRRRRRLLQAAALLLAAAGLAWLLLRPEGPSGRRAGPHKPPVLTARLRLPHLVGRPVPNARYRLYGPDLAALFRSLVLAGRRPALTWHNLALVRSAPYVEARADAAGRLHLSGPLPPGKTFLVYVEKPGFVGAWGLLTPTAEGEIPPLEAVLTPALSFRIEGVARDAQTGAPLADVLVATPDGTGVARSDAAGRFAATVALLPNRRPTFYALAPGRRGVSVTVSEEAYRERRFRWEPRLVTVRRSSLRLRLVGLPASEPLPEARVFLYPDLEDPDAPALPSHRRLGAELALPDAEGVFTFRDLMPMRYRLVVEDPTFVRPEPRYVSVRALPPGEVLTIHCRPAGEGALTVVVTDPLGRPARDMEVLLLTETAGEPHLRFARLSETGSAAFTHLPAGRAELQLWTPDGAGRRVVLALARGERARIAYRLAATPHRLRGRAPDGWLTVRLEGELPPLRWPGGGSIRHTFAVEAAVGPDGTFRFPPLPRLRRARVFGRPAKAPETVRPLRADPDPASLLRRPGGEHTVFVTAR